MRRHGSAESVGARMRRSPPRQRRMVMPTIPRLRARSQPIEGTYCPSPDERGQPPCTSRPVNRSHTTSAQRDRWSRYGAFVASIPEQHARYGTSYKQLNEHTIQNPSPVYARRRQPPPGALNRHPGKLDIESVRRRIHTRLGPSRRAVRGRMSKRDRFFDKLERRASKKRCRRCRRKFTPPTGYTSLICPPCRRTESAG